jgi:hypothetical protein
MIEDKRIYFIYIFYTYKILPNFFVEYSLKLLCVYFKITDVNNSEFVLVGRSVTLINLN